MREELKEIFQDAWIAADFIQKAKDVIEARPLVQMAHKAIAELAEEAKNLPPEVEPEPVIEPEPQPEPIQDLPEPAPPVGRSKRKKR